MNRFLDELHKALVGNIPDAYVKGHIDYYRQYIYEEKAKGRKEADILAQLGEPRLIAKNIINTSPIKSENSTSGHFEEYNQSERSSYYDSEINGEDRKTKKAGKLFSIFNSITGSKVGSVIFTIIIMLILMFLFFYFVIYVLPIIAIVLMIKILFDLIRKR